MSERPRAADAPQIDTPVIDMQDLEHKPGPDTRIGNKGVKVEPFKGEKEDEEAREAVRRLEESLVRLPPG